MTDYTKTELVEQQIIIVWQFRKDRNQGAAIWVPVIKMLAWLGEDLLGRVLMRLLTRLSSFKLFDWGPQFLVAVDWGAPSVVCCLGFSPFTAWWKKMSQPWAQDRSHFSCNLILEVAFHHLCHIVSLEASYWLQPTLKGWGLFMHHWRPLAWAFLSIFP